MGAREIVYPARFKESFLYLAEDVASGGEVMRSEAMFRRFHTASMPDYCLSGAYLRELSMQCFIPARSDPIRKQSQAIGFWK